MKWREDMRAADLVVGALTAAVLLLAGGDAGVLLALVLGLPYLALRLWFSPRSPRTWVELLKVFWIALPPIYVLGLIAVGLSRHLELPLASVQLVSTPVAAFCSVAAAILGGVLYCRLWLLSPPQDDVGSPADGSEPGSEP